MKGSRREQGLTGAGVGIERHQPVGERLVDTVPAHAQDGAEGLVADPPDVHVVARDGGHELLAQALREVLDVARDRDVLRDADQLLHRAPPVGKLLVTLARRQGEADEPGERRGYREVRGEVTLGQVAQLDDAGERPTGEDGSRQQAVTTSLAQGAAAPAGTVARDREGAVPGPRGAAGPVPAGRHRRRPFRRSRAPCRRRPHRGPRRSERRRSGRRGPGRRVAAAPPARRRARPRAPRRRRREGPPTHVDRRGRRGLPGVRPEAPGRRTPRRPRRPATARGRRRGRGSPRAGSGGVHPGCGAPGSSRRPSSGGPCSGSGRAAARRHGRAASDARCGPVVKGRRRPRQVHRRAGGGTLQNLPVARRDRPSPAAYDVA